MIFRLFSLSLFILWHFISFGSEVEAVDSLKPSTLTVRLKSDPQNLNPLLNVDDYADPLFDKVFDTLLFFNPLTGKPEGRLAESWKISKDGLQYDFFLRPAIFHDGVKLTAIDVKFTFDSLLNPKIDSGHLRSNYEELKSIEVISPNQIRFKMKTPYFRSLILIGRQCIVPKHIYNQANFNSQSANRQPVGSGPYVFKTWDAGQKILVSKFKDFWGNKIAPWKGRYQFDQILYRIITDDAVAAIALKKGDIDFLDPSPLRFVQDFSDEKSDKEFFKLKYETEDGNGYNYIGWNLRRPLFQSKDFRQALAYAMPREEIKEKIYLGLRELAVGPFPRANPKTDLKVEPILFDLEKAKQLLSKANVSDKTISFELLIPSGSSEAERMALIYQSILKKLNIDMSVRSLEWTAFMTQVRLKKFDAFMMSWGALQDLDPYRYWHSSQTEDGNNFIGYKNARVDFLLLEARQTLDAKKRMSYYREISRILADEAPYLFLFEKPSLLLVSKKIQGVLPIGKLGPFEAAWSKAK
ncbi:MAG: hypothetical protein J0L93_08075 [Deltaproteobacteria bacterium]|nr:hypothetical protein [Deltaproteobacteria bacterium]